MTSTLKTGLSSERVRGPPGFYISHLACPVCHELPWKPVACQSCETPFCSTCIHQWLANNPFKCPNRCRPYTERKCPPFIVKLLSQLQIACFYQSAGCNQIISYEGLDKHEIACGFQSQQCSGCQLQILKKDFDNHMSNCPSMQVTCQDCKLIYKRGDTAITHTENICLREQLRQLRDECKENKRAMQEFTDKSNKILAFMIVTTPITFHDLPISADQQRSIPNMYRRLEWVNMCYVNELFFKIRHTTSGYTTSFMAGGSRNIAFFEQKASVSVARPNEKFTFFSVAACAAWNDNLQLTITGHRNSIEINTHTEILLFGKPKPILLFWENLDKITLESSGGTAHPMSGGGNWTHVLVAQLTIGPFIDENTLSWNIT
ncbi:unnamed protein product [Rotaria sp. Silwood1]|nr:unnamed protein product [Rotaria sp. Silwood1]